MCDLAYVTVLAPGKLEVKCKMLIESLVQQTKAERKDIFVFVDKEEKKLIDKQVIEYVKKNANLVEGRIPIEDYKITSSMAALKKVSEITSKDYIALLDTDTIVLDDLKVQEKTKHDLYVKPVDLGNRFWGREDSNSSWKKIYDEYDFPTTKLGRTKLSTVDKLQIPPYYNSGVVITKNNDFPERWLDITISLREKGLAEFFSDQVGLSVLSSDYHTYELNEEYNFPQSLRIRPNPDTKVVHYHNFDSLRRAAIFNEKVSHHVQNNLEQQKPWNFLINQIEDLVKALVLRRLDQNIWKYLKIKTLN